MSGWQEWLDRRRQDLVAPYGWLSLIGLHWLDSTPQRFADLPGEWSAEDGVIRVKASVSDGLFFNGAAHDGRPFDGVREVKGDAAEFVAYGRIHVEALIRDGRPGIRLRDPEGPARQDYEGPSVFDYAPEWVVSAGFTPRKPARRLEVDGRVTLDFNQARNFPSAFTDYGICPMPPDGNEITVPVTAGERIR